MRKSLAAVVLSAGLAFAPHAHAAPLTPTFTYQGEILKAGAPVTGTADLRFSLFDAAAGGVQIGATIARNNVSVSAGVFTVGLDFGADAFADNQERYLQIEVRSPAGAGAFTVLGARQAVTVTPYAITAGQGAAPFRVKRSTSSAAVVTDPDDSDQITLYNDAGVKIGGLRNNLTGSLFAGYRSSGAPSALIGTSIDASGFIEMYAESNGYNNVLIESETSSFGESGLIRLGSLFTGGKGGVYQATNNDGSMTLEALGGESGDGASLSLFDANLGTESLRMFGQTFVPGGSIHTFDENGATEWVLEPDFSGDGAFMLFSNPATGTSLSMESDFSDSPAFNLNGENSFFGIFGANSGNASVQMSSNAVNSLEILDEPGLANNQVGFIGITTTLTSVISRSITVPAGGFVLVLFDGDVGMNHVAGSLSYVEWIIDDVAGGAGSGNDDMLHLLPTTAATGLYDFASSSHAVFAVPSAGTYTYHVNMARTGATSATLFDGQMTVIYFPTAYGTVNPSFTGDDFRGGSYGNAGPTRMPQSGAEIAAERARSQADNMARIQSEMLAMKQEMAEMRAMMASNPNIAAQRAKDAPKAKPAPKATSEQNVAEAEIDEIDTTSGGR